MIITHRRRGSVGARRQLPPGVRARPNTVGYLGPVSELTVLNPGDSLTGTPFTSSDWIGSVLVAHNVTSPVDRYLINAGVVIVEGALPTVTNCVIRPPSSADTGINVNGATGTLTITDTTVEGSYALPSTYQNQGIGGGSQRLISRRCDVSGTGDGIHAKAQPGASFDDGSLIDQCYVHDLTFIDPPDQHSDGIQIFQDATLETWMTVSNSRVDPFYSPGGLAPSSAFTAGAGPTDGLQTLWLDNNGFFTGAYHQRVELSIHNAIVTNNDYGFVNAAAGEFGLVVVTTAGSVATWTNNRDGYGNIVENPNP